MEPSYQIKDGFPLFFRLISTVTPECTLLQDGVGSVQQHKRFLEVIRVSMRGGLMPCGATASKPVVYQTYRIRLPEITQCANRKWETRV